MGVNHTTNLANSGESLILTGTDAITRVEKMLDGKELVNSTPRNMLASAIGLTMSGVRSRCNLFSDELAASRDLLQQAVEGHIPLVIHVTTRTDDTHINSLVDSGALILYAGTVQEAIDFTLIARAVAEQTLTPAVVVMEYEVSSKPQSIELPSPQLIERIVGDTTDKIKLNHPSQQIVFGPERKRLPCRYNLDHPTMQGAVADKYSSRVNKISHTIFFGAEIGASVDTVFHKFNEATGREYSKLSYPNNRSGKRVNKRVLICQGEVKERCKQISEKISSKENYHVIEGMVRKSLPVGMLFMIIFTGFIVVFGEYIYRYLIRNIEVNISPVLVVIFGLYFLIRVWTDTFTMILQAGNNLKPLLTIVPIQAFVSVSLQIFLSMKYGVYGLLMGLIISFLCTVFWYLPYSSHQFLKVNSKDEL